MLDARDAVAVQADFGVARAQVERDWAVSHLLSAIAEHVGERACFFGGTALSYTVLRHGRLSEDIDLWARADRADLQEALRGPVTRALRRTLGPLEWIGDLATSSAADATGLRLSGGDFVQVQLLPRDHYPPWPLESRELHRRYRDVPAARMLVPTIDSFIAWKTVAWLDRRAPRDLWDLWALAQRGPFGPGADALFRQHGQFPPGVPPWAFDDVPDEQTWQDSLSHQTRLTVGAAEAAGVVRGAWQAAG